MVWLTPWGAAVAALALLPLGARALAHRRVARARAALGLPAPPARARRVPSTVVACALVALAVAQPCIRTTGSERARTDAAAFVVLDISRSMAASAGGAPDRLAQAERVALAARATVPDVPVGVATLTDRVLPNLLPTADAAAFDSVVRSVQVEDPPPRDTSRVATSFDALGAIGASGFFRSSQKHRAILLVTDGESRPFDPASVQSALRRAHISLVTVRVGAAGDRIRSAYGVDAGYRPDTALARESLARLGGGGSLRSVLGKGPSGPALQTRRLRPLAPALLAIALLVVLLGTFDSATALIHRLPWPQRDAVARASDV